MADIAGKLASLVYDLAAAPNRRSEYGGDQYRGHESGDFQ